MFDFLILLLLLKVFDTDDVFDTPSIAALKELAFRGMPAYDDAGNKSLFKELQRVEVTGYGVFNSQINPLVLIICNDTIIKYFCAFFSKDKWEQYLLHPCRKT